jgi:AcrR family transcriptional regulator
MSSDTDSARERLIKAAAELFYQRGIHAVGVDAIVEAAGVAKMSLYHHFGSKDGLVAATLRAQADEAFAEFSGRVNAASPVPRARLLAVFDVLQRKFTDQGYRGCAFLNALAEIPSREHPAFDAAALYHTRLRDLLRELAAAAGARQPDTLAAQLAALVAGAIPWAVLTRSDAPARQARAAAEVLVRSACQDAEGAGSR